MAIHPTDRQKEKQERRRQQRMESSQHLWGDAVCWRARGAVSWGGAVLRMYIFQGGEGKE